ncbi:hypothetical protein AQJ30_06610 [Streptomyces longwoodensis]|uniref:Uncharacterized protein n=1 Tax=Streptomyces longwoodensis TaxID=68231 RepID=A0A124HS27_9ACTN|nr:hypothetical protein AQJ30_06610 [Streptomyces longwoodensis]
MKCSRPSLEYSIGANARVRVSQRSRVPSPGAGAQEVEEDLAARLARAEDRDVPDAVQGGAARSRYYGATSATSSAASTA